MAQNLGEELTTRMPHVDLVVGTDRLHELPHLVRRVLDTREAIVRTGTGTQVMGALQEHEPGRVTSFVSVMRGCNQFCSYCIVPYVRGREKSRPTGDIVAEVREVVQRGTREIFLLGQNITAYGLAELRAQGTATKGASPFAELLQAVDAVPGVERIRFTSPHPKFMNETFIGAVSSLRSVCESFHVPLQSGSDRILAAMGRGYTAAEYRAVVGRLKQSIPGATFSTDVIVGFPGETDEDFAATRAMMDEVGFEMAYVFKYSPRSGTKAAGWPDDVPQGAKEERNQILLDDLGRRASRSNRRYGGGTVEVLVEGESKRNAAKWTGRSRDGKVCIFERPEGLESGDLATVEVTRTTANSLFGRVVRLP
jgi:tRNA-2-methylthio-N6-dimethylallyladenosine synthase